MKAILITGSSQGIGLGIARHYAAHDYHICINYLNNKERADGAVAELRGTGGSVSVHRCDVRDETEVKTMYQEILASGHQLETVVCNATDEVPKAIDEATFEEWHRVLLTKLDGAFLTIKYSIPQLKIADNPAIVIITSSEGWKPDGEYLAYQVGTAGLISIMVGNSKYLASKYGIRVNAVAPGPVPSQLWEKAGQSEEMWASFRSSNPMKRVPTVEDVAAAVWFVAEDPKKFINGTTVNIDGGSQWV